MRLQSTRDQRFQNPCYFIPPVFKSLETTGERRHANTNWVWLWDYEVMVTWGTIKNCVQANASSDGIKLEENSMRTQLL